MSIDSKSYSTHLRVGISESTLLKSCSWNFEFWYRDALQFFAESFSSKEGEWLLMCLWYNMTESILQTVSDSGHATICGDILQDLARKLGESQIDTALILRQVLYQSALYQQVLAEYGFDGGIANMGYHWTRRTKHSQTEFLNLSMRALPFWVFHEPYAARFAECWITDHHVSQYLNVPAPSLEFPLQDLLQTANYLARHTCKPLCELLFTPTVSGARRGYCTDRESLFFSLMKSGLPYKQAGLIVRTNSQQANYGPQILKSLTAFPLEQPALRVLAHGAYLPPRARAARKVLQLVELY